MEVTCVTRTAPKTPAMGSTMPEACPYIKLLKRERPSRLSGMETAAPSGKFCIPMPMATAIAGRVASGVMTPVKDPKATPTAKPSGIL